MHTTPPPSAPVFPRLRRVLHPVDDIPAWRYPSELSCVGTARLRAWATSWGHLAMLTWTEGTTPSGAPRHVHNALRNLFPEGQLTIIEHVPDPDPHAPYGHWDQLADAAAPGDHWEWRRIWPVPRANPDYVSLRVWISLTAPQLGIPWQAVR